MDEYLKRLRLPTIREQVDAYLREANEQQITYEEFLFQLLSIEIAEREIKKKELARKKAQFPVHKVSLAIDEARPSVRSRVVP
uniref:ATP-binding protein n=1 Tax=Streptomyces noursei TaxID=1971 RepID=UPI0035D944DF